MRNNRNTYETHLSHQRTNRRAHRDRPPTTPEPRIRLVRRRPPERRRDYYRKIRLHRHLQFPLAPLRPPSRAQRAVVEPVLGDWPQPLGDARIQDGRERPPAPLLRPALHGRPQRHHRELRNAKGEPPPAPLFVRDRHRGGGPSPLSPLRSDQEHGR